MIEHHAQSHIAVLPGDDMKTDPASKAGDRIACSLIVK
jgi:Cu/Zn superoxide dismutase